MMVLAGSFRGDDSLAIFSGQGGGRRRSISICGLRFVVRFVICALMIKISFTGQREAIASLPMATHVLTLTTTVINFNISFRSQEEKFRGELEL